MIKHHPKVNKEIEKAVIFMVDQIRKHCLNEKPLIMHSLRVGMQLFEMGQKKEVVMAGFLHDLLEDTACQPQDIKKLFGKKVSKLVMACTFDREIKDYKKRWGKAVALIRKTGKDAALIRLVDANENIVYLPLVKDPNKFNEVLWKHRLLIDYFKKQLGNLKIFKEYARKYKVLAKRHKISAN